MRSFGLIALAIAALAAAPTLARDRKPLDPDKRVCRRQEVTGSIMPAKPICHTVAEWAEIDAQNGQDARTMRDQVHRGIGGSVSGG